MVKAATALVLCILPYILSGCSTPPVASSRADSEAELDPGVRRIWTGKMPGLITDLNVSDDGASVLISLVPDPERFEHGGISEYQVRRLSLDGKVLWATDLKSQVKHQVVSEDGSFVLLATYDGDLGAYDSTGRLLWEIEASCRPYLLNRSKRIVCYHDDDAEPGIAFDVYDWQGKKLLTYPAARDILALKLSRDDSSMVIGLTRGQVILFGGFRALWQRKVPGEIIDVAVGAMAGEFGPEQRVAVLFASSKEGQRVAWFDQGGRSVATLSVPFHADQLDVVPPGTPSGQAVILYGNGPQGQFLAQFEAQERKGRLSESWRQVEPRFADYTSVLGISPEGAIVGLEEGARGATGTRTAQLASVGWDGQKKWRLPVVTEEGAYIYSFSRSSGGLVVAIGNDDSVLSLYRVETPR